MKRTAALVAEAARLRAPPHCMTYAAIGRALKLSNCIIYRWLNPTKDAAIKERKNLRQRETRLSRKRDRPLVNRVTEQRPRDADAAARMAEIPVDDRPLDARLTGLPLRGRSALDRLAQRKAAETGRAEL